WRSYEKVIPGNEYSPALESLMHKTIKNVSEDVENLKFNTAIAKLMTIVNAITAADKITRHDLETILLLLNPFAPHLAEEMWQLLGNNDALVFHQWPTYDASKMIESTVEIVISINGKIRERIQALLDTPETDLKTEVLSLPKITEIIGDKPIRKFIVVPNKLVNIVI
ncbi:MAG: class I tRNA ligase family protein, partial [Candidatus Izemoplasmatales bacterium]